MKKFEPTTDAKSFFRPVFIIIIGCLLISVDSLFAQREADRWYFGYHCGLDFATGEPVLSPGYTKRYGWAGIGTICDSNSNLLFYCTPFHIYNKQHEEMDNSNDLEQGAGLMSNIIVPWPDSDSLYIVFVTKDNDLIPPSDGLHYHVVDMSLNNGLGKVIEKNVPMITTRDSRNYVLVAKHKNKRDYWVITLSWSANQFAVYLVTPNGVSQNPVYSPCQSHIYLNEDAYEIKLSHDKKYLFGAENSLLKRVEIYTFDDETGLITFKYNLENEYTPSGIEFSPDSKYAYISYHGGSGGANVFINQYDMQYINNFQQFRDSAINLGGDVGMRLQLATDGKIYAFGLFSDPIKRLGVINKPWEKGVQCAFNPYGLNMAPDTVTKSVPVMLLDYLLRFDYEEVCAGEPFQFTSFFNPVPQSIYWTFNDPLSITGNNSTEINPEHIFSSGGIYEVEVDVWYPSGRFEHTSRMIEVEASPEPDLGPDISVCVNSSIILDAECGPYEYAWSTGQVDTSRITVSDTGWYWVNVSSDGGCSGYDSIHISQYPESIIDSAQILISPTTCGGNTGAIRNVSLIGTPPFSYYWTNDIGDTIASTPDIHHLPVGNYTLHAIDGNGCNSIAGPFLIDDVGDVLIEGVTFGDEHCNLQDAFININAISGLNDMLFYSIDNGSTWESNFGLFNNVDPGTYAVRVKDSAMCQDVFDGNPIIINHETHPDIIDVQVLPEISGQGNGQIHIIASSSGDTIYYSINSGSSPQINNGMFTNLVAGFYTCIIKDEYGCDTTFTIEVPESISTMLEAIAGNDGVCPGEVAYVPLTVTNFINVASFNAMLTFINGYISCKGFTNANPLIEDSLMIMLFPAENKVKLTWSSDAVSLPANTKLLDLVFDANNPNSLEFVQWDDSVGANVFLSQSGTQIPVSYQFGQVSVFSDVRISVSGEQELCVGDTLILYAIEWSHNGPLTYFWEEPGGLTSTEKYFYLESISENESGNYLLKVTDTAGCFSSDSINIVVNPNPVPEYTLQDTIVTEHPIELDAGSGYLSYLWNSGDTTQFVWANIEGWYKTQVISQYGCIGSDSSYVVFTSGPEPVSVYFPNAFTPNGDGINDYFNILTPSQSLDNYQLTVFNRWGQVIFISSDINTGWDGTYQGNNCMAGTYVFIVTYSTSAFSSGQTHQGIVTLVR